MPDERDRLIERIRRAFAGAPRPATLAHCNQCELWVEALDASDAPTWDCLPDSAIAKEYNALTAVTAAGWPFLAPAYLIWYLRNPEVSDSNTTEHLIYQLSGDPVDEHIRQGHAALSSDQRAAIAAFLGFIQPRLEDTGEDFLADFAKRGIAYWSRAAV
jgi:hypothetical protein